MVTLEAFDYIERKYLFRTLEEFSFGEGFINWVKLFYSAPCASVSINGRLSSPFEIGRGTKQGCPLSPLLFALVIEPLAEIIRLNISITGIHTDQRVHTILLYADDVLLFLSNPESSVLATIKVIN